jgi:hypothetical protein
LVKNVTLDLSSKKLFGDSVNVIKAFDNDHTTMYDSANNDCELGVDMGENLAVLLTRIRYFPNYKWPISSLMIKGGKFQGSVDNGTWVDLASVDSTVHAGWNSIMLDTTAIYRYIKFVHTGKSRCNIV